MNRRPPDSETWVFVSRHQGGKSGDHENQRTSKPKSRTLIALRQLRWYANRKYATKYALKRANASVAVASCRCSSSQNSGSQLSSHENRLVNTRLVHWLVHKPRFPRARFPTWFPENWPHNLPVNRRRNRRSNPHSNLHSNLHERSADESAPQTPKCPKMPTFW